MARYFPNVKEFSHNVHQALEGNEEDPDYFPNVVLAAYKVIKEIDCGFDEEIKCKAESEDYRNLGNSAYRNGYLQKALIFYNKAIAYAPNGSLALKLAYSNRSAVLFTAELYKACEKDCSTALGIECQTPKHVIDKLRRRKIQALGELRKGDSLAQHNLKMRKSADEFYKLPSRNNEIPCASKDVDVIVENGIPKVIAKRDIGPGTLVALEKAFVSWAPSIPDQYFSCYYCRKLDLNLFPCGGCVAALFCTKECEEACLAEYHSVECQIVGNILTMDNDDRWLIKSMIKLRNMCSSWGEFVALSNNVGSKRLKKDTINKIFDGNKPTSLLSFNNERHFTHGAIYQYSFLCAIFLKYLLELVSFLPQDSIEKLSATKAFARIMMHLSLYSRTTSLVLITDVNDSDSVGAHTNGHRGIFPFVGKLKHSCVPNLQKVALNNTMALFSVTPIKAGTELTVTHVYHWLDNSQSKSQRKMHMLQECHTVCTCFVCKASPKEWKKINRQSQISESVKQAVIDSLSLEYTIVLGNPVNKCFEQMYTLLSDLKDVPFTDEYEVVYKRLGCLHAYVLNKKLNNMVLALDM